MGLASSGSGERAGSERSVAHHLHEWYRKFLRECPSGMITQHEFRRHVCAAGALGPGSAEYAERLFSTMDTNADGAVDFLEFVTALSLLLEGSPQQRLHWSFQLCDRDSDGAITRAEMLEIMNAVCRINVALGGGDGSLGPVECTERIFAGLDKDHDALITLEEFTEGALADAWLLSTLQCDPARMRIQPKSF
ncbi:guanylyl cyclase inhibitory protein-like isoform X1 [Petromyzon marinus]|uniref:Guanylyl cyclase inhibitory protein-like isoform X1 n=1 Tax=Petromyzon marinus TaxID=7757 RepID=A0AAJ7SVC6_PETMA|nr:guanylyl cyclase inhibitory protein-like isoform X1 [Petromyzon marinus]XP_032805188.1 guanylyl cyclase inhibitory protein-like isoform X1 [Petromyzon marinus]